MAVPVRIGLLGFGTVGRGVQDLIEANRDVIAGRRGLNLHLASIGARDLEKHHSAAKAPLTANLHEIVESVDVDVVIEAIGGVEPAFLLIKTALESGKCVATANKELIAKRGAELIGIARQCGVDLRYESSVMAGTPILAILDRQLQANRVRTIEGIVNGTTNMILTKMAQDGMHFEDALALCQNLGYAEADPSSDIDGLDATYKLTILASIATGIAQNWETVDRLGIRGITLDMIEDATGTEKAIKLIARAEIDEKGGTKMTVKPEALPNAHPLATVDNSMNGIVIETDQAGRIVLIGPGAGGAQTASGLVGDVVETMAMRISGCATVPHAWSRGERDA